MAQPTASSSASERRQSVRTGVVWDGVRRLLEACVTDGQQARIVDIGGGTGGFAVPLAEAGHRVLVVDPSPDALAALSRRAAEAGVTDLVTGRQGDLSDLPGLDGAGGADLVLCHGVLEVVDHPAEALRTLAGVLRPGGTLSLLVAQRHAAVVARAMAGHFTAARELLDTPDESRTGRRYTADELTAMLVEAGFAVDSVHGVRVFSDLVPSSLHDLEPGATAALLELEQAVAERPEYLPLATQLHVLATR
jgi:2-polyprenyl-3-methyl-5-hydroxy-6-metoxy-1,4-benzoquinol methylase